MDLGINIRNWGKTATAECLADCARIADASTLDSIWLNDHIGLPPIFDDNPYEIPPEMAHILDPLGVACFFAGITSRIRFGTGVLILPYRPPLLTVKWLATIQTLSRGRFMLGAGVGYLEAEFRALGLARNQRGRLTDATVAMLQQAAAGDTVESNGEALVLLPRLEAPPLYFGGAPNTAIPRAVRQGDGWMPVGMSPQDLAPHIVELQRQAQAAGRPPLAVVHMKTLPLADTNAALDLARAYADVGVTHLVHTQGVESADEFANVTALLCAKIKPSIN